MEDSKLCPRLVKKEDLKNFSKIIITINSNNMKTKIHKKDSIEKDTTIKGVKGMYIIIKEIITKDNIDKI